MKYLLIACSFITIQLHAQVEPANNDQKLKDSATKALNENALNQFQTIKAVDASNYIGKKVTICDTVTSVFTSNKSEKAPRMLDIGGKYPNNRLTAVVFKDETAKFSYQLSTLQGKAVCITGMIKDYKGKPEIIIDDEKEIVIK